jgi:hypothetical protein
MTIAAPAPDHDDGDELRAARRRQAHAERMRRQRQRAAHGRKVYSIEADEVEVEELLLAAELLTEADRQADGEFAREAIEAALVRLLHLLARARDASRP